MNSQQIAEKLATLKPIAAKKTYEIDRLEKEIDDATLTAVGILGLKDGTQLKDIDFETELSKAQDALTEKEGAVETSLTELEQEMSALGDLIG